MTLEGWTFIQSIDRHIAIYIYVNTETEGERERQKNSLFELNVFKEQITQLPCNI